MGKNEIDVRSENPGPPADASLSFIFPIRVRRHMDMRLQQRARVDDSTHESPSRLPDEHDVDRHERARGGATELGGDTKKNVASPSGVT